jgi:hypothetical protein
VRCSHGGSLSFWGRVEGAAGAAAALLSSGHGRHAFGLMPDGCPGCGPVPGKDLSGQRVKDDDGGGCREQSQQHIRDDPEPASAPLLFLEVPVVH